jgi:hypothetical protein
MEDLSTHLHEDPDGAEEEDTDGDAVVETVDEVFRLMMVWV